MGIMTSTSWTPMAATLPRLSLIRALIGRLIGGGSPNRIDTLKILSNAPCCAHLSKQVAGTFRLAQHGIDHTLRDPY